MKCLFIISLLFLASCSAPKLYQSGMKKIEKAIQKDPSIKLPADTTTIINTIVEIDTVDNEIIRTITNNIVETINDCNYDKLKTSSRRELRHLRKMYKDSLIHDKKMYRLETKRLEDSLQQMNKRYSKEVRVLKAELRAQTKQKKHETKSSPFLRFVGRNWWLILIIGLVVGFYIRTWIPRIPNLFKQKQDG